MKEAICFIVGHKGGSSQFIVADPDLELHVHVSGGTFFVCTAQTFLAEEIIEKKSLLQKK